MVEMAEWTDKRLDDLAKNVDSRFDQVDRRFDQAEAVSREIRGEMNERFSAVDARFDAMQRTLIIGLTGVIASICGSATAAILANQL